jgi:hypothetical protein
MVLDKIPHELPLPFDWEDAKEVHGFRGQPADKTWYGVEIELEYKTPLYLHNKGFANASDFYFRSNDDRFIQDIDNLNDAVNTFSILKYDGSLTEGIEIVTAPCSFDIQMKEWEKFYNTFPSLNFEVRNSCGMHVHVSKKHFNKTQILKLREFISKRGHRKFFTTVASRGGSKYCVYTYDGSKQHYDAINVENKATIEFRLFKSPNTFCEFARCLELVKAVIDFIRSSDFTNDIEIFQSFIKTGEYPNLNGFCEKAFSDRESTSESQKLAQRLKPFRNFNDDASWSVPKVQNSYF